jgi:hypothetical protein
MTRLLVALIAVSALVATPTAAPAKEVTSATVCGAAGCKSSNDKAAVAAAVENGGPPTTPPRHRAAFYRITIHIKGDPEPLRLIVAPSIGRVRGPDGTWSSLPQSTGDAWREVVGGVRPFPAALLPFEPSPPSSHTSTAAPKQRAGGTAWGVIAGITATVVAAFALGATLVTRRRRRERTVRTA